ncbi:hypothetical protein GCM10010178_11780 [Lentzea flava]|uniref:Uncharacterized protein n=1 Tax=Lentzea flava TaxID=103732 RepID=A0ABQ2UCG6_9PSEU|nr:hypothetical protein GCM10010178_11780 [Lentzea flava]
MQTISVCPVRQPAIAALRLYHRQLREPREDSMAPVVILVTLAGLAFLTRTVMAVLAVSSNKDASDYPKPQTSTN